MSGLTILLAGDSTVATYPPEEYPMSGWGAHLEQHLHGLGTVRNFAKNGATTSSVRADGLWDLLMQACRPGDWVLIQFGHNDQKLPELAANGGYTENLETMVADVRARHAIPVLCTSVERRYFQSGRIVPTHGAYPLAVRRLGDRLGVAVIDLTTFTSWLYEHYGVEGSRRLLTHLAPGESTNWPDGIADDTHFSEHGAQAVASYVARALRPLLGLDSDAPPLGPELMARQASNQPGATTPRNAPSASRAELNEQRGATPLDPRAAPAAQPNEQGGRPPWTPARLPPHNQMSKGGDPLEPPRGSRRINDQETDDLRRRLQP